MVIGHRVVLCTTKHSMELSPVGSDSVVYPTILEDNAIIEPGSIILPSIRIGEGSLVKAGSVVTKNVPPFTKVSGNPAKPKKFLKSREIPDQIEPIFISDIQALA